MWTLVQYTSKVLMYLFMTLMVLLGGIPWLLGMGFALLEDYSYERIKKKEKGK